MINEAFRRVGPWPRNQPEAVLLDFVRTQFLAILFFNALRFLVAVSSDLSGSSCMLKAFFNELPRQL